jgi:phage terminase small subunit
MPARKLKSVPIPTTPDEWARVEEMYDTSGPDAQMALEIGRQAWARWRQIVERLDAEGLVLPGRYRGSSRLNPLVAAETAARDAVLRVLKALDLPPSAVIS